MSPDQQKQINLAAKKIASLLCENFQIKRMEINGISNEMLMAKNNYEQVLEEYLVMHGQVMAGDEYLEIACKKVIEAINSHVEMPVVRFADGEYEFYDHSLKCNGLYQQAKSIESIKQSIPLHVEALRNISEIGLLAPLLFPGNLGFVKGWNPFGKYKGNEQGVKFLKFMAENNVKLSAENYVPFYVVYAMLTSPEFLKELNGKNVCIVNSDYEDKQCNEWFDLRGSKPFLSHIKIPATYVATEWQSMRNDVLRSVPRNVDLFLVGAGVGALLVCSDLAKNYSVPAIDAGHVLNMINGKVEKSNGDRLYTFPAPTSL